VDDVLLATMSASLGRPRCGTLTLATIISILAPLFLR
jgi:hypothetical protein